jgi:hypothetical protein
MPDNFIPAHFTADEDFRTTIEALYLRASRLEQADLEDFAAIERYIQQSYEGRSLFELIQNGRDAAQLAQQPGLIELELVEQTGGCWLLVRNSGQPFTPAGVNGITRIGQSTKADVKTIGFKGIGFKAVKQLTDHPRVVTRWGTLLFDATLTRSRYLVQWNKPAPAALPLFRLPHYVPDSLTPAELARGIATRVELPLRNDEARTLVEDDLAQLKARQLVLLGMVRKLIIRTPIGTTTYEFEPRPAGRLDVVRDGQLTEQYRLFEPTAAVTFPAELLHSISSEEREIMERMTRVDIRLLLLLDARGRFVVQPGAELYLFYPLLLASGFRFLIHSFFLVDPARTTLRPNCRPNEFLLQQIGRFVGGELVTKLVASNYDTTEILCYQRVSPAKLTPLYDAVQQALQPAAFIHLRRAGKNPRYLRPTEVMCTTPTLAALFPSGRVAERWLVPLSDPVRRWLRTEFGVPELTATNLGEQLELECARQVSNVEFFQRLYQFLAADKSPELKELKNRRLLLTQQNKVVAGGEQTVFYRTKTTVRLELSKPLQRQIHLLHASVQLTDSQLKSLEARTGLREMEPDALAAQLLRLMANEELATLRPAILRALKDLAQGSDRVHGWFPQVRIPVQGGRWLLPLNQPVYLHRAELRELYPKGLFVDRAAWPLLAGEDTEWDAFLLQLGAWDKPGLYITAATQSLPTDDPRNARIREWKPWSTGLLLRHDRLLHVPAQPTEWFTQQLLTRWSEYRTWLGKTYGEPLEVRSQQSEYWHDAPTERMPWWCGAMHWLRTASWVVLPGQPARAIADLVGIAPGNSPGTRTRLAENFLPIWRLDPDHHKGFITAMRLAHLNARHLTGQPGMQMLRQVLQLTASRHPQPTGLPAPDFENFYNMLLSRLEDYWEEITDAEEQKKSLVPFRSLPWLARNSATGQLSWQPARQLLHLDDKPAYDRLVSDLRSQPALLAGLPAQFYHQFTKRDANGFGRLAQHLGQVFTTLVRRSLQQVPSAAAEPLLASQLVRPDLLLRLVALLESQRHRQFTLAELARLRAAQIASSPTLLVDFQLVFAWGGARSVEFELEQPYYLAKAARPSSGSILYVQLTEAPTGASPNRMPRSTAEALAALLTQVLDTSTQYLRQALPNLLAAEYLEEFDSLYQLSPDRLTDLQAELYPPLETPEGLFWQAVRRALGLPAVSPHPLTGQSAPVMELLFDMPGANTPSLAVALGQAFADGTLPQSVATRNLLDQLLQETGLSVAALNTELAPPILFDALLETEWGTVREQYRTEFKDYLHAGLTGRPAEQVKYLSYLAQYDQLPRPKLPNQWRPDYQFQLIAICTRDFGSLLASAPLPPPRDAATQYEQTLGALRTRHGQTAAQAEQLSSFLQAPSRRSLLFFGQLQKLEADYATWLRKQQAADTNYNPTSDAAPPTNPAGFNQPVSHLILPPAAPLRQRASGGSGGAGGGRESQQARDRIGRQAEERAWVWLREQGHPGLTWVSANAQKVAVNHPAHNPHGSDEHHYDLHYLNKLGELVAVEVKGTSGSSREFYLSREELAFAECQPPGRYRLLFITQALDDKNCRLYVLENPFLYDGLEDRWHNRRFRAEADTVRVSFDVGT